MGKTNGKSPLPRAGDRYSSRLECPTKSCNVSFNVTQRFEAGTPPVLEVRVFQCIQCGSMLQHSPFKKIDTPLIVKPHLSAVPGRIM